MNFQHPYQRLNTPTNTYSNTYSNVAPTPTNTPSNRVFPTPHTPQAVGSARRGLEGRCRFHRLHRGEA